MEIVWKIFEISAENELITHAKYYCSLSDDTNTVETEGNWFFKDPIMNIPFGQVTEEMVAKEILRLKKTEHQQAMRQNRNCLML